MMTKRLRTQEESIDLINYSNDTYSFHVIDDNNIDNNIIRGLLEVDGSHFDLILSKWNDNEIKKLAISDYLLRSLDSSINSNTNDNNWIESYGNVDQFIVYRSCITILEKQNTLVVTATVYFNTTKMTNVHSSLMSIVTQWIQIGKVTSDKCIEHYQCLEDQYELRSYLKEVDGIAFVANGSILPRAGGDDDKMLCSDTVIPFKSPVSLEKEFTLRYRGKVKGMLIPKGVTVITGGGYHGKSTLLNALKMGIYDKIPGDGREYVIIDRNAATLRSEDGRYINSVDVSSFISNLPAASELDNKTCNLGSS